MCDVQLGAPISREAVGVGENSVVFGGSFSSHETAVLS